MPADVPEEHVTLATRGRTVSDMMSGMAIDRNNAVYGEFTESVLQEHFMRFKQYDVDNSGFISPQNIKAIFEALEMTEATEAQCENMIAEVAILTGHENDGQLSFRDYCHLMAHEAKKLATDAAIEAQDELKRASMADSDSADEEAEVVVEAEERAPGTAPDVKEGVEEKEAPAAVVDVADSAAAEAEEPAPQTRMRGSSFAVLDQLAVSRIQRFEQAIADKAEEEKKTSAEVLKQTRFQGKLAKFKKIEEGVAEPPRVNNESMHMATLRSKLAAFEAASKKDPVAFKTTWKNVHAGAWKQKKQIAGGIAPKKSLADLP